MTTLAALAFVLFHAAPTGTSLAFRAEPATASPAASPLATLDVAALLEPIRARHDLPGMVAAVVGLEGAVAIGAVGVRERGSDARLESTDRMHLGSCTKSMTATLAAKLVESGALRWDTTVGAAFGDLGHDLHADWKPVTLAQLLSHRSGASGDVEPALWARLFTSKATARAQREELARETLRAAPAHPPGTKFVYSNTGFALAGLMLERAAKKDFEALLHDELFVPLGMRRSGFGPPGSAEALDEPRGHRPNGKPVGLGLGSDNPPAIAPAGRVHASLDDWARHAALHLTGPSAGGLGISAAGFARLHAVPPDGLESHALGWGVAERAWGGRVLTHAGSNTMWFCVAWLAPEKGFGVLVATNQGGDAARRACDEASSALIGAWRARTDESR